MTTHVPPTGAALTPSPPQRPEREYAPTIRTMWLTVDQLRLSRGWVVPDERDDDGVDEGEHTPQHGQQHEPGCAADADAAADRAKGPRIGSVIKGVARLDRGDRVALIGSGRAPVCEVDFLINGRRSDAETTRAWARIQQMREVGRRRREREARAENTPFTLEDSVDVGEEVFDTRPPDASLHFWERDREHTWPEHWDLGCDVPHEVMEQLARDVESGMATQIELGIKWHPTLTDSRYAPPSVAVTYGVLERGAHGRLVRLTWSRPPAVEPPRDPADDEPRLPASAPVPAGAGVDAAVVAALATTVRRGFVLVLLLIALVALIR